MVGYRLKLSKLYGQTTSPYGWWADTCLDIPLANGMVYGVRCLLLLPAYSYCWLCKLICQPTYSTAPPFHATNAISDLINVKPIVIDAIFVLWGGLSKARSQNRAI